MLLTVLTEPQLFATMHITILLNIIHVKIKINIEQVKIQIVKIIIF